MECTAEEREFLDKLNENLLDDVEELRMKLSVARLSPELRKRLVLTRAALIRASAAHTEAWEQANAAGLFGHSNAFRRLYEEIESEAKTLAHENPPL